MASSDATPLPKKGVAYRVYFPIKSTVDGSPIVSWTGAAALVSLDGAAFVAAANTPTEISGSGVGYLDLLAATMNADNVIVKVTVTNTNSETVILGLYPEEAGDIRTTLTGIISTALTEGAVGRIAAAWQGMFNIAAPVLTTASVNQTGDNFARIGAPVGASISADIAGVQSDTNDIQTRLPAALVGGRMDSSVEAIAAGVVTTIQSGLATATKLLKYVQLLARKDAAIATDNATELTEINANGGSGAGGYVSTTDSQEAIKDALGSGGITAADVWNYLVTSLGAITTVGGYFKSKLDLITAPGIVYVGTNFATGDITLLWGEDRTSASPRGRIPLPTHAIAGFNLLTPTPDSLTWNIQRNGADKFDTPIVSNDINALTADESEVDDFLFNTAVQTALKPGGDYYWYAKHTLDGIDTYYVGGDVIIGRTAGLPV